MAWPFPVRLLWGHNPDYYPTSKMGGWYRFVENGAITTSGYGGQCALTFDESSGFTTDGTNPIEQVPNMVSVFPGDTINGGSGRQVTDRRHFQIGSRLYCGAYPAETLLLYAPLMSLGWIQCQLALEPDGTLSIYQSIGEGMSLLTTVPGGPIEIGWNTMAWYGAVAALDGWSEVYQAPGGSPAVRRMYAGGLATAAFIPAEWLGVGFGGNADIRHSHMHVRQGAFEWGVGFTDERRAAGFMSRPYYTVAPGVYQQWYPNTGTFVGAIDDTTPDDSATIVGPVASGAAFSAVVENIPATRRIYGVQPSYRHKRVIATANLQAAAIVDNVLYPTPYPASAPNWSVTRPLFDVNPKTNLPWLRSHLNDGTEWGGLSL